MKRARELLFCVLGVLILFGCLHTSAMAEDVVIEWSHLSDWPMPGGPRYGMASAVIGDKIYLIGGRSTSSSPSLNTIEVYDTTADTTAEPPEDPWETKEDYSWEEGRYSLAASVVDGKIYLIGGLVISGGGGTPVPYVDIYDPEANTITPGPPLNLARNELASAVLDGKIYALGGQNGDLGILESDRVEVYNPNIENWEDGGSLNLPRTKLDAISLGNTIYAITGVSDPSLERYELGTSSWQFFPLPPAPRVEMPAPHRFGMGTFSTVVGDKIYTVGGQDPGGGPTTTVKIFDPASMTWETGSDLPVPKESHSTVSVGNKIYVFGGRNPSSGDVYVGVVNDFITVAIDIKPGSDPNCFNLNGHGVIPVAILGSADFDVSNINVDTLSLAGLEVRVRGNKGPLCSTEYSNEDEFLDLVCHFEDDPDNWVAENDLAELTGELVDGTPFKGTDSICVVP